MPWVAAIVCLALFASSPPYAQQDDSDEGDASTPESSSASEEEEEVEVRVDENVFVPSEEISQDNAVAFPVDI
jgi:hypothetical protein